MAEQSPVKSSDSPASVTQSIETTQHHNSSPPATQSLPHRNASQSTTTTNQHQLHPRSCVTCRKRKVRCDKRNPCSNCTKAHIECIFPPPGRAPRKPRKPPDSELLARLRKLEGVVQSLGGSTDDPPHSPSSGSGATIGRGFQSPWDSFDSVHDDSKSTTSSQAKHNAQADWAADHHRTSLDSNFGRLVLNEGKSRYINNSFWANLSHEVEDLKEILISSSDQDQDDNSPGTSTPGSPTSSSHHGFMFGISKSSKELHRMHPPPHLFEEYWRIFEGHVNPLIKMIHIPTTSAKIKNVKADPGSCPKGTEALLFAIYFSAITSLSPEECKRITGESRAVLVSRYRHATEQALAHAHFLVTEEMIVLQAFIIFLLSLRLHEDPRHIWSLTGLVVRIAVTMGLHRDGALFNLSPFDVEMRRRLWWQVCILDLRLSEDHGCDPSILEHTFDTKFPLNINDEDITPAMKEPPAERTGVTEMTFCLIRFEVTNTFRRLNYNPPRSGPVSGDNLEVTIQDKERWIEECHQRLEENYLQYCNMNSPMHWVICTVARLVMAKLWLQIYQPFQRIDAGASLDSTTRDRLFITSLESIEYHILLQTESRTVKWGWLFKTYSQWHALSFLLSELCHRTRGPTVQRAWRAIDATIASWGVRHNPKRQMWRPLRKLLAKARAARDREVSFNNTTWDSQQHLTATGAPGLEDPDYGLSPLAPTKSVTMTDDVNCNIASGAAVSSDLKDATSDTKTSLAMPNLPPNAPGTVNPTINVSNSTDANSDVYSTNPNNITLNPDTKPFASSPFFANQPQIVPSNWPAEFQNDNLNGAYINEILTNDPGWNYDFTNYDIKNSLSSSGNSHMQPQFNLDSTLSEEPLSTLGNGMGVPFAGGMSLAQNQDSDISPTQSFAAQGSGSGKFNPSLNGSGVDDPATAAAAAAAAAAEDEPASWEDWDDMVREFELENGADGNLSGARRPIRGVPWF